MFWQILVQFFPTYNCSKVLSHHPRSEDVFIFPLCIKSARCAKPQCFGDQIYFKDFPLGFGQAPPYFRSRLPPDAPRGQVGSQYRVK